MPTSFDEIVSGLNQFNSWKEKAAQITDHNSSSQPCPLALLESCLNQLDLFITLPGQDTLLENKQVEITSILAKSVLPLEGEWIWYEDEFTKSFNAKWTSQKLFMDAVPLLLVVSVHWILYLRGIGNEKESAELIQSLLCYIIDDGSYPWTIPETVLGREKLLSTVKQLTESFYLSASHRVAIMDYIKPYFVSHSKHASVSAAGRKLFTVDPDTMSRNFTFSYLPEEETNTISKTSWRTRYQYALTLLEVFISYSTSSELQTSWSFIVPCVLNIVDDHNPGIKRKGADLVEELVQKTDSSFFKQTGVAPVFWSALEPALSYLPPSTPATVSIPLARSTYHAMMALSYVSTEPSHQLHHRYFQEGILTGISHAHNHVAALVNFLEITVDLVLNHMKAYTTPHLKSLVAIVTGTLCDPFVTFSEKLVSTSCDLAEAVIRTTWFRVVVYRYDILRGLITVSKRIADDSDVTAHLDSETSNAMKLHIKNVLSLLQQAVDINAASDDKVPGVENFTKELAALCDKEPHFST